MEEKRRKRIILIGRSTAGKTTLSQRMNSEELRYYKTQAVQVVNQSIIDTPGEYVQSIYFRGSLMVASTEADVVVLVQDATDKMTWFPPSYNTQFNQPVIGVITKADLATPEEIENARGYLKLAGVTEIFVTSSVSGDGVDKLLEYLDY